MISTYYSSESIKDSLEQMRSEMKKNLRDTLERMEREMKEVKEKLGTLKASGEKNKEKGQSLERLT